MAVGRDRKRAPDRRASLAMCWRGGVTVLGVAAMVAACGGAGSVAPNPSSDAPSGSPAAAGTNPLRISEATANPTEAAPGIRILVLGDSIALKEMDVAMTATV